MHTTREYDDIINLSHHVSQKYKLMPQEARAAQFAPFAALTGYGDAVKETARLTSERIEIDEEQKTILDSKLQLIRRQLSSKPKATFTYFIPDLRKNGGVYVTVTGCVKNINEYKHIVVLEDKTEIPICEIIEIKL